MKNRVIFIGAIDKGNVATNGETMKNQLLLKRFDALFDKVVSIDTYQWEKHPWIIISILWHLIINRGAKVVVSASGAASYLFLFLHYFPLKKNVYDWVIGGSRATLIRKGVYRLNDLKRLNKIIVEGESMVLELKKMGLDNVVCVPNFKPVDFIQRRERVVSADITPSRFVFLSRIHPDKGVKEIIESCRYLNENGYEKRFFIDFYGAFDTNYQQQFNALISPFKNIEYKGFLNLMEEKGYEELSKYDAMLFPTYWEGEGFPGIAIDAYMSGLPIIASDWSMNKEVIDDGITGCIIPVHDSMALATKMKDIIDGEIDVTTLRKNCIERALQYDYRNVVSKELLTNLGLIS